MPSARFDSMLCRLGPLASIFLLTACAQAQPVPAPPERSAPPSSALTKAVTLPLQLCVPVDPEGWKALRTGARRLVLHLQNQEASHLYSPSFLVYLVEPLPESDPKRRIEVGRFSMHPDLAVSGGGAPRPQHFAFDLRDHLPARETPSNLCVEVDIEAGEKGAAARHGAAPRISATVETVGR